MSTARGSVWTFFLVAAAMLVPVLQTGAAAQSAIRSAPGADRLVEAYVAYIGRNDVFNSRGVRLSEPWQIIRQDRANYHRFGIRDRGDESDGFFALAENRERLEAMLRMGRIEASAARALVRGDVWIRVEIYQRRDGRNYVEVTIE